MNSDQTKKLSRNIFLIGFMGCGKSTVSGYLCRTWGLERIEMDAQIESEEGRTIPEIFAREGEAYFRELETGLLQRLGEKKGLVVSCGGGAAMRDCNVREMKRQGIIVLLSAKPQTVYERVRNSHNRPLLEGNMNVEYIRSLMEKRTPKYEAAADIIVKTDDRPVAEIGKEIIEYILRK